jgi:hypothetical protein
MISIILLCGSALLLGCSDDDNPVTIPGDEAPPVAISNLTVRMLSGGDVELSWDASTQANLRGYNVYRHIKSEQAIGKLTASPITANRFVDSSVSEGPVYEYFVTAVSSKGLESAYAGIWIDTHPSKSKGEAFEN